MKAALLVSMLLASSVSFAGPEEHYQAQTCYSLQAQDASKVSEFAPQEICFEELTIDTAASKIYVYSYFGQFQHYLKGLNLTSLVRQTEDEYSYSAESVIFEKAESHCEDGVKLTLKFDGRVDFAGFGNIEAQSLSLVQETKADVCHSTAEVTKFNYVRTR